MALRAPVRVEGRSSRLSLGTVVRAEITAPVYKLTSPQFVPIHLNGRPRVLVARPPLLRKIERVENTVPHNPRQSLVRQRGFRQLPCGQEGTSTSGLQAAAVKTQISPSEVRKRSPTVLVPAAAPAATLAKLTVPPSAAQRLRLGVVQGGPSQATLTHLQQRCDQAGQEEENEAEDTTDCASTQAASPCVSTSPSEVGFVDAQSAGVDSSLAAAPFVRAFLELSHLSPNHTAEFASVSVRAIILMRLCDYIDEDICSVMAHASAYLSSIKEATEDTVVAEMSVYIVVCIYLAHGFVLDKPCPLHYWRSHILEDQMSIQELNEAIIKVSRMRNYKLRVADCSLYMRYMQLLTCTNKPTGELEQLPEAGKDPAEGPSQYYFFYEPGAGSLDGVQVKP